jgi:hypothetical protein
MPALTPAPHRARAARRILAATLVALALGRIDAPAAPLRAPRPAPAPLPPLSASAGHPPQAGPPPIEHACGTDLDRVTAWLDAAVERQATTGNVVLPTPHSTDVGEIAVLEDDGTFFFPDKGGNINLDVAAAARAFYRTHGDDYDQVAFWLATGLTNWLGSPTALAAMWPIRNATTGLGLSTFSYNAALGLPSRLQTVLTMNGLQKYPDDPAAEVPGLPNYVTQDVLAHEFGHQWLAYPLVQNGATATTELLGRAYQHWSFFFDADASPMEGPDWVPVGPDTFRSDPPIARFGVLDQYLMGVRPAADVPPFFVISPTAQFYPPGNYVTYSDPNTSLTAKGPSTTFTIQDVVTANGPRVPAPAASPVTVRMATVLVVARGTDATPADLAKLETIRATFPTTVSDYTGGRMLLDAALDSRPGRLRLVHRRLPDTETAFQPRPIGVRVSVDPAGIPTAVDPNGVTLRWRTNPAAPWNDVVMSLAAADSFTALLPGQPDGTTIEYTFHATSDQPGVEGSLPGHGPPFRTRVGADVTAPVVTHWAQHAQAAARMPQALLARVTDDLGLQSVFAEYHVNAGPLQTVPATATGSDSFTVSLGAGAAPGSAIAYRIVARDAATAQNLGFSNAMFDTLRVGTDHVDGFWNPSPWIHGNIRFNRRDEWHPVELDAAPSGSGAWHCGNDSIPYGPYQDAGLTSGLVFNIAPGCSLSFSHRHDLENWNSYAFDGGRVEVQVNGAEFVPITPVAGYTHTIYGSDEGLPQNAPCWSGRQAQWRVERFDLSPYAPGPIRVRFRMSSDLYVGAGGWWVDDVRFHFPGQSTTGVGSGPLAGVELGPLWPNPVSGAFRQALRLPAAANVDWSLYDPAGRRVATLWRGRLAAGARELVATPPRTLALGLYFSRVTIEGRALEAQRVAIIR